MRAVRVMPLATGRRTSLTRLQAAGVISAQTGVKEWFTEVAAVRADAWQRRVADIVREFLGEVSNTYSNEAKKKKKRSPMPSREAPVQGARLQLGPSGHAEALAAPAPAALTATG